MTPMRLNLDLAQAIITAIAEKTGREVRGAEIYAFTDYLQVTVSLAEDGVLEVEFRDPLAAPAPKRDEVAG